MFEFLATWRPWSFSDHEIRAEAFALGGRHQGEVIDGALAEAKSPGVTTRRANLLRAVIRSETRRARGEPGRQSRKGDR